MNALVANEHHMMQKFAVRVALVAVALGAIALATGSVGAGAQDADPGGLRFVMQCSQAGPSSNGGLGSLSCTLKVTGLPDLLDNEVTVTVLSTADDVVDSPDEPIPSDTVVSSQAPSITPGAPVLVSRRLSAAPPPPPPLSPQVPKQPPQSL